MYPISSIKFHMLHTLKLHFPDIQIFKNLIIFQFIFKCEKSKAKKMQGPTSPLVVPSVHTTLKQRLSNANLTP